MASIMCKSPTTAATEDKGACCSKTRHLLAIRPVFRTNSLKHTRRVPPPPFLLLLPSSIPSLSHTETISPSLQHVSQSCTWLLSKILLSSGSIAKRQHVIEGSSRHTSWNHRGFQHWISLQIWWFTSCKQTTMLLDWCSGFWWLIEIHPKFEQSNRWNIFGLKSPQSSLPNWPGVTLQNQHER